MYGAVALSTKFDSGDSTGGAVLLPAKYEENLAMYRVHIELFRQAEGAGVAPMQTLPA